MTETNSAQTSQPPADASGTQPAPAAAAGANAAPPPVAARPEGIAESFWDAGAGALKVTELAAHLKGLETKVAEFDKRAAAVPQKADDYKLQLPADLKMPDGVKFEINANDPVLPAARVWAHHHGIDQAGFERLVGVYAQAQATQEAAFMQQHKQEMAALGVSADARLGALKTWAMGVAGPEGGAALLSGVFTAAQVTALEKIMLAATSGGMAGASNGGRASGHDPAALTAAQKIFPSMKAN